MRAIVCTEYGTPDTLELQEIQDPVPGPEQVLVRIHAAGVNFVDSLLISGRYQIKICLLYTSDAADERSSVDLGGRRIIKKKK